MFREREGDRQTYRQTETRQDKTNSLFPRVVNKNASAILHSDIERDRDRERETDRQTDRDREREREREDCRKKDRMFVCWLLNVPATCECISGTDLLRQFYVLPH